MGSLINLNSTQPLGGPNMGLGTDQGDTWDVAVGKINAMLGLGGASNALPSAYNNFRNMVDGGDFTTNPWQRGTSFTTIASTVTYTADRWFVVGGASSSISVSQKSQTDVPGFGYSMRFGRGAGTNTSAIYVGQVVETLDSFRAQSQYLCLSFWLKTDAQFSGANVGVSVVTSTASNQSASSLQSGGWSGSAYAVSSTFVPTATATRYSFTSPAVCNSNIEQIGVLFQYSPSGTNNTSDTIEIYGVQLEVLDYATQGPSQFEHRDVEVELALCQRFFFQINEPATSVVVGTGMNNGTSHELIFIPLPVQMRAAPTVTVTTGNFLFNLAGTNTAVSGFTAGTTHTVNYISVAGVTTSVSGQACLLVGGNGAGTIAVSADL